MFVPKTVPPARRVSESHQGQRASWHASYTHSSWPPSRPSPVVPYPYQAVLSQFQVASYQLPPRASVIWTAVQLRLQMWRACIVFTCSWWHHTAHSCARWHHWGHHSRATHGRPWWHRGWCHAWRTHGCARRHHVNTRYKCVFLTFEADYKLENLF